MESSDDRSRGTQVLKRLRSADLEDKKGEKIFTYYFPLYKEYISFCNIMNAACRKQYQNRKLSFFFHRKSSVPPPPISSTIFSPCKSSCTMGKQKPTIIFLDERKPSDILRHFLFEEIKREKNKNWLGKTFLFNKSCIQ